MPEIPTLEQLAAYRGQPINSQKRENLKALTPQRFPVYVNGQHVGTGSDLELMERLPDGSFRSTLTKAVVPPPPEDENEDPNSVFDRSGVFPITDQQPRQHVAKQTTGLDANSCLDRCFPWQSRN
ncbi:hypothetical protein KOR34_44850 [Posidoniimonas corsicana]|uniref:Uncharacterized protein n=1 Tax=Posidoniimonas corsicana TaxID=1938618 RepID=A0A5C5UXY6_9BACT|nr:hypothetical protein [Posidoniimonas corsicana]TWT31111.1 hypothetical protein KOR34_44850 [Posidoniimonas corsicana]